MSHLVGVTEIAERLGASSVQTVHAWRRRYPDFPAPVAELKMGHVWYWPAVKKWWDKREKAREGPKA